MKELIAAFLSMLAVFTTAARDSVGPIIKGLRPPTATVSATPTSATTTTVPSVTPTPTATTQGGTQTSAATPTNVFTNIGGNYYYVITMRPKETIRVTTMRPMKGSQTISVELPPSGAPPGVFFTQDQANDRNIFINTSSSVVPGRYEWRQSFISTFSTGVAPGNLSFALILNILPAQ